MSLRAEEGFTLIELLSAVFVVSVGVIALITTFDTSRRLVSYSETKETAVHVGEQELERLQTIDYDKLALSGAPQDCTPSPCTDPNVPAYYLGPVIGAARYYRWDQDPTPAESRPAPRCSAAGAVAEPVTNCEQLVIDSATPGEVEPSVTALTTPTRSGDVRLRLELQRFVTWVDDDCARCPAGDPCPLCTGAQDYKRITVAVRIGGSEGGTRLEKGPKKPVLLSTVVGQ